MDKYIGKILDNRYEILEVIGVGGMAVVYKAMCHRLNRLVAIKILKDEYSNDEEFRRRFHGESQAVAMMSHPNIVNVFDVSSSDGLNYIVMELIDGITLKQYMEKKGILSWRETLHFSMQIAKALEHAHSRGIIHRDIKPHNVMILKDGSVKVADFGIARVASAQNTLTKEALGSVHYISPEQARGARIDSRTDLYSLGVVMYQMLAGRPPYDGDTPVAVAIMHINGNPVMPSLFISNIPTGLEQITMHAMCADLNNRYASASEMLHDMEELRKNPSLVFNFAAASNAGRAQSVVRAQAASRQSAASAERAQARKLAEREKAEQEEKKRRLILIVAAILAASVLLVISALIISAAVRNSGKTPSTTAATEIGAEDVKVPNFVGAVWSEELIDAYPQFELVVDENSYEYSDRYEAGVIIRQDVEPDLMVKSGRRIYLTVSKGQQGKMPDLTGKSLDYAKQYFEGMNYKVIYEEENSLTVEKDRIIRTDPAAGLALKDDDLITVYYSIGPRMVKVPSVTGLDRSSAGALLDESGFQYKIEETYSDNVAAGKVISQTPDADTEAEEGSTVIIFVSVGRETVPVPNVVGENEAAALDRLQGARFGVNVQREYNDAPEGTVFRQDPASGSSLAPGTTVTIYVSKGPEPTEPPASTQPSTEAPPEPSSESAEPGD